MQCANSARGSSSAGCNGGYADEVHSWFEDGIRRQSVALFAYSQPTLNSPTRSPTHRLTSDHNNNNHSCSALFTPEKSHTLQISNTCPIGDQLQRQVRPEYLQPLPLHLRRRYNGLLQYRPPELPLGRWDPGIKLGEANLAIQQQGHSHGGHRGGTYDRLLCLRKLIPELCRRRLLRKRLCGTDKPCQ